VKGKFQPGPFAYPNYRDPFYIEHLEHIRELYLRKRRRFLGGR